MLFTPTTPLLPQAQPSFVHYRFSSSGAAPHAHPATQSCKPVSPCSRSALWAPSTRRTCWSRCESWNDFSSPVVRGQQPEQMTAASSGECCCLIQLTSAKGALFRFACYRWILVRANDSRNSPSVPLTRFPFSFGCWAEHLQNLLDLAVAAVMWWSFGWGIAFGAEGDTGFNQFVGPGSFFTRGDEFRDAQGDHGTTEGYSWALWLFQV